MPYRNAHLYLAALLPLIVIGFWPGYFSVLRTSSFALHAHGLTASAWIALVAWQNWTIRRRRPALHRAAGLAVFVAMPLFAAGGLLAIRSVSVKYATAADPFSAMFGARLVLCDLPSVIAVPLLVAGGLAARRRIRLHAAYMLATVMLVLPPLLGRLVQRVPIVMAALPEGLAAFPAAFHIGQAAAAALALWLYARDRRDGRPFLIVAALIIAESVAFETVARTKAWPRLLAVLTTPPPVAFAALGLGFGVAAMSISWRSRPARPALAKPALAA